MLRGLETTVPMLTARGGSLAFLGVAEDIVGLDAGHPLHSYAA
jgi:hypothetical protein